MTEKKIYKVEDSKKIFGVCGGIAEYFEIDPTIVRVVWAVLGLVCWFAVIVYIICAIVFPKKSKVF